MVSLSIESSKDADLREDYPDINYGSETYLGVYVFGLTGDIRRAIFEFDLSALIDVPTENISSVVLRIYVANEASPRTLDIRKVDNDVSAKGVVLRSGTYHKRRGTVLVSAAVGFLELIAEMVQPVQDCPFNQTTGGFLAASSKALAI